MQGASDPRVNEVGREEQCDRDHPPDDGCVQRTAEVVTEHGERLRDGDPVLAAREAVPGRENRERDEVERKRRECEVVAVEAEEGHADRGRDNCCHDRRGEHREHGRDPGSGVDEPRVRVDAHGEDRRRVGADEKESSLPE